MKDLVVKEVSFSYPGDFLAVDNISMEIKAGENVAIVGQNGAGTRASISLFSSIASSS